MNQFDMEYFKLSIIKMASMVEAERDYLTSLDSDIGDGDHGINLSIGFREVTKQFETFDFENENLTTLFKKVGMALLGKVGGASGPLYGSFFMKFGVPANSARDVDFCTFVEMFSTGVEAIQMRGKAELGDKTMLDALLPAKDYLNQQKTSKDIKKTLEETIAIMKKGAESTEPLIAKKGRAMRLGERAIGHRDPGSESSWKLFECFLKALK
ncbi:dihydroxyacetone kinase [Streptococcus varani]|jgi:dihydroxyacetone kinase-like protein|uniref:phosphoenolpyruvate--glycerone phosphotransferase n=1 Tax=Streptococcus varani TaxID=1608583 RepID=A0A0E4H2J9_9STRE|nr:dihydroxyacetone kinase subunit DhaL [Streptococcus varani]CQR23731.1 dihydroxyacetone kinase [Streptococcus varani]